RPCGPGGAIADGQPRARANAAIAGAPERRARRGVDRTRRVMMADPYPKPKPDKIEPQSPPERPTPPMPQEDPAGQPPEVPGHPGGGDTDEPGRGPDELPPQQV